MAAGFSVFGKLRVSTAEAEAQITRSFAQLEGENKKSLARIERLEKKRDRERERRSKERGQAIRRGGFGVAGGVAAAAAAGAKDTLAFQRILGGVQIQAGASAEKMALFEKSLTATSRKTALSKVELASAAETLTNLLGPAAIEDARLLDLLARTAVATGAEVADLGGLVSAVSDSMGIAVTDVDGMEKALSAFVRAGKEGKIPLSEMASVLQDVSSTFKEVGVGGVQSAADLSSALQVLRKSTGSAAAAGTVLEAGISSLVQKSDEFKKVGIEVFTGKGPEKRLRGLRDILDQIADKRLNIKQLQDILGRKEAVKFFRTLQDPAARAEFERLADAAANATDISEDFGKKTATQGFRIAQAMNEAKLSLSEAMTPERIETFVSLLTGAVQAAGWLADGFVGVGTAIGEAVFDIEDAIIGTRKWQEQYAATRREIDGLKNQLEEINELLAKQRSEGIALAQELAVLGAAETGVVTREQVAQALEQQAVIGPAAPAEPGIFAPVTAVQEIAREAQISNAMTGLTGAIDRLVEQRSIGGGETFTPELLAQIREVRLDPATIRELNQNAFERAQNRAPSLDGGKR